MVCKIAQWPGLRSRAKNRDHASPQSKESTRLELCHFYAFSGIRYMLLHAGRLSLIEEGLIKLENRRDFSQA